VGGGGQQSLLQQIVVLHIFACLVYVKLTGAQLNQTIIHTVFVYSLLFKMNSGHIVFRTMLKLLVLVHHQILV